MIDKIIAKVFSETKNEKDLKYIYVDDDIKQITVKFEGKEVKFLDLISSKFDMASSIIRADAIITSNIEKSKDELYQATSLYNFLIEDNFKAWRKELPENRVFLDYNELGFES